MTTICQGDVQYVNCCFTREKITLVGDRRNSSKSHPTFKLLCDDTTQVLQLQILSVLPEKMFRSPKERVDIYILKAGAQILRQGVEQINAQAAAGAILDRGNRSPRDPEYNYDDSGVPLQIDSLEAWAKVNSIEAFYIPGTFKVQCLRKDDSNNSMPRLNVDVEHDRSRLHIGIEANWDKNSNVGGRTTSSIIIDIPWSECAHLLLALNGALAKM